MKYLLLIITLAITNFGYAQKDYRAKLVEYNGFSDATISPSEDVIYGINNGKIYKTNSIDDLWKPVKIDGVPRSGRLSEDDFKYIRFVTDKIIVAFSEEYINNAYKCVSYTSKDKGKSWKRTEIGEANYRNKVFIDKQKRIWVSSYPLKCSEDYGLSWKTIELPSHFEDETINMSASADGRSFYLACQSDTIYKTTDKFSTWEYISSPTIKNSENKRPLKVSNFDEWGQYYIAKVGSDVYYRPRNEINWTKIENVREYIIQNDSSIYFFNNDLSFSLADAEMKPKWQSIDKLKFVYDLHIQNDKLYIFLFGDIYDLSSQHFNKHTIYTDDFPIKEPDVLVTWNGQKIGFEDNDVLLFDEGKKQWYRDSSLPINFNEAGIYNDQIILADYDLTNYYIFNFEDRSCVEFTPPKSFLDLTKVKPISVRIEKGSQGCFHNTKAIEEYEIDGQHFSKTTNKNKFAEKYEEPLNLGEKKDSQLITNLLDEMNNPTLKPISIQDLEINLKDIEEYKSFMQILGEKFNEDYEEVYSFSIENNDTIFTLDIEDEIPLEIEDDFLYARTCQNAYAYSLLADSLSSSISSLPDSIVTVAITSPDVAASTTTSWMKLSIQLDDNSELCLYNEYYNPNYLHTPWIVEYKGLKIKTNSLKIGRLIGELGENKLMRKNTLEKKYAIHQIIAYLYYLKK